jgi:glyoxylase-like metal-dependent hydrolase (beta-lactamase superfamily II)
MTTPPHTFQLGAARIALINLGELQLDLADALRVPTEQRSPEHRYLFAQPLHVPVQCIYIELPDLRVLVDAGRYEFPPDSPFAIPNYQPPPDLLEQLAAVDVEPERIDHVIITHMHFDHFNGLLTERNQTEVLSFPQAEHHIGRADWERREWQNALRNSDSLESRLVTKLELRDLLTLVEGDAVLSDEVQILATSGETPGHQAVRIHSREQFLYCVGDLYHHPTEVAHPTWMVHWADAERNLASKQRIAHAALAEDALLIATHIPGVGRLRRVGAGVGWVDESRNQL